MAKTPAEKETDAPARQFDDVLKRMLSTPPKPHKEDKAKPADQPANKRGKRGG